MHWGGKPAFALSLTCVALHGGTVLSAVEPNSQRENCIRFLKGEGGIECKIRKNEEGEMRNVYTEGQGR